MYLLDTNVISEGIKRHPYSDVMRWFKEQDLNLCYLSVLTVGEIIHGIQKIERQNQSADRLRHWLSETETIYADRILGVDKKITITWGGLIHYHSNHRIDMLIAATAITHRLTLVTRNSGDFARIPNLQLLNPFTA